MSLLQDTKQIISIAEYAGMSDVDLSDTLLRMLYSHSGGDILNYFMILQEEDRKAKNEELNMMYQGLQESMHNFVDLGKQLLENKTSKQAKSSAKLLLENEDGNIAHMINTMKSYFPNGTVGCASGYGKWFYNKFVIQLMKHKEKYLPNGESYDWVKLFEHEEYINLILKENE